MEREITFVLILHKNSEWQPENIKEYRTENVLVNNMLPDFYWKCHTGLNARVFLD